jgi:hypothetical protein
MLFLLLLPALAIDSSSCVLIACQNISSDSSCLIYSASERSVYLNYPVCGTSCDFSSLYLPATSWASVSCAPETPTDAITGAACSVASNCSSWICSNPVCWGVAQDVYCPDDGGCQPGYWCDSFTCQPSLSPGDPCTTHNSCPVGYGCDAGSCTIFFAKLQGTATDDKKFCKSNFAMNGTCDSLLVYIQDTQILAPFNCKVGTDVCVYKSKMTGAVFDSQPCACAGVLDKGGGYCSYYLEWADEIVQDQYVYMTYSYSTCSGNYSHTDDPDILNMCGSLAPAQYEFFFNLRGRARYWSLFQSGAVDNCSVDFGLFNATYDMITYAASRWLSFAFLFLALAFCL